MGFQTIPGHGIWLGIAALRILALFGLFRDVDDADIIWCLCSGYHLHGVGRGGANTVQSSAFFDSPSCASHGNFEYYALVLLLRYEQKNILTRSWCYALALLIVISKKVWLLRYDPKNLLIHSWCYVVALPRVFSNTGLLLRYEQKNISTRSWCYVVALPIVISNTFLVLDRMAIAYWVRSWKHQRCYPPEWPCL